MHKIANNKKYTIVCILIKLEAGMDIRNILGLTLKEARNMLEGTDLTIKNIKVTAPPKETCNHYNEDFRVARVRKIDHDGLELVVLRPL